MNISYPNFLKVRVVLANYDEQNYLTQEEKKQLKWVKAFARINPIHISSYIPAQYIDDNGVPCSVTNVTANGQTFYVDMEIEKFDKVMEDIDRDIKIIETE